MARQIQVSLMAWMIFYILDPNLAQLPESTEEDSHVIRAETLKPQENNELVYCRPVYGIRFKYENRRYMTTNHDKKYDGTWNNISNQKKKVGNFKG